MTCEMAGNVYNIKVNFLFGKNQKLEDDLMKHTFAKLMALLMALTLMLTGCNLIEVDQLAVIEQERAEVEKDLSTVLVEYDGGTITKFDVMASFYGTYSYMAQLYTQFGMSLSTTDLQDILQDAVDQELKYRAISKEFEQRGMTLEESEEELRAEGDESYQSNYDYVYDYVEGDTDEIRAANAELALYSQGYTRDYTYQYMLNTHRATALEEAVKAEITEISEEELQAAYDEKLAADEATYTETPTQFETDASNSSNVICWRPEGYRTVKHVLVIPEDDVLQAVTDARSAVETAQTELTTLQDELDAVNDDEPAEGETVRTPEEIQADIDAKTAEIETLQQAASEAEAACLASVQDKTDEIYAKLAAGESFDAVMEAYGEDPGMQSEPNKSTGYYVCADSTRWDANFTAGAMLLEKVGDYSQTPVISTSGVHIIYYNSDVTPGAVALEEVRDALYEQTLSTRRSEYYDEQLASWVEALNPVYHLDAWTFE